MIRYKFINEIDETTRNILQLTSRRASYCGVEDLSIEIRTLRKNGEEFIQAVEAKRDTAAIRIRVIMDSNGYEQGINISIPCSDDEVQYKKYLDLRNQIRNSGKIMITFKNLSVRAGKNGFLYFTALDYKVMDPRELASRPVVLI